jgi:nitroreductase
MAIHIDEFLELVKKRRSIRRFKSDPIPDEDIGKILEAARWAMSGGNAQPWEFILVKDQEKKKKMVEALFEQRKVEHAIEQTRIPELRHPGVSSRPIMPSFADAPVLIVVCGDRRTLQASVLAQNFVSGEGGIGTAFLKSVANATQNMQLAAAALGLGSQWVSIDQNAEELIRPILGVPGVLEIHTIVPVGYAAYEPSPPYRRDLDEIVHLEEYDKNKFRSAEDITEYIRLLRERTGPGYRKAP